MAYKIAIASSDGTYVDETFGSATRFLIFTVNNETIDPPKERIYVSESVDKKCSPTNGCSNEKGCGNSTKNCGGSAGVMAKVALMDDCRCVVCRKIGFQVQKQLERKAISYFDVSCSITEALNKITAYYRRVDQHQALRKALS